MKRWHRILLTGVLVAIAIGLLFWLAGSLAGVVATVFGGVGAVKVMQDYQRVEDKQRIEAAAIERTRRKDAARIRAQEAALQATAAHRKAKDKLELQKQMAAIESQEDADKAVDKSLQEHDRFLSENGGFAVGSVLAAIVLLGFFAILLGSCPAQAETPITPQAKEQTRKILDTLNRYRRLVIKLKGQHKLELRKLRTNHRANLARARNDLVACQAKKQIIAKRPTPPTWPYLLAGAATGALIVGGVWLGATIAARGK